MPSPLPASRLVVNVSVALAVEDPIYGPWEPAQVAAEQIGRRLAAETERHATPRKAFANRPGEVRVYWITEAPRRIDAIRDAVAVLDRVTRGVGEVADISVGDAGDFTMANGLDWNDPTDT
jgi:hypothetical protein